MALNLVEAVSHRLAPANHLVPKYTRFIGHFRVDQTFTVRSDEITTRRIGTQQC